MGNSYVYPNINQNNLHPPLRLSSPAPSWEWCLVHGWGKGCECDGQHSKSPHRLSPPEHINKGWILRLKCLPLPQHPTVHEEKTRRRHWRVLRSPALEQGLGWIPPVSPSGPGNTRTGKGTLLVPSSGTGTWKGPWLFNVYYWRYYYGAVQGNMPT